MSDATGSENRGCMGQALVARARLFKAEHETYLQYADAARDALGEMVEGRLHELKSAGVVGDTHDSLLNQLRGLRNRFAEVDAITRSILLQVDGNDPIVWEEALAFIQGLISIELEAKSAQRRVALAAVLSEYVGGHSVQKRTLTFDVDSNTAKRFHALINEVRAVQVGTYGRNDTFTQRDLLERLLAVGTANIELLAKIGTPTILSPTIGGRFE